MQKKIFPDWKFTLAAFSFVGVALYIFLLFLTLPPIDPLLQSVGNQNTVIDSSDGVVLARLGPGVAKANVPLTEISPFLRNAVIAVEDRRFYAHRGVDIFGMGRAVVTNLVAGRWAEGGSTITQQLVRTVYLTRRKTIHRKLQELLLSLEMERVWSKDQILELYLNNVYWGHNNSGIDSAARVYFGKAPAELGLAEAATLAGMLEAPEYYSPYKDMERSRAARVHVLEKMKKQGYILPEQFTGATDEALTLATTTPNAYKYIAPYFSSYVVSELQKNFDKNQIYHDGLIVHTTLDYRLQQIAQKVVQKFVREEGEKYKFSQMALVALDPGTGNILAMVGGVNFRRTEFNRAVQARRSPGSSFKPFIYTTAVEMGYAPGHILDDAPVTFHVPVSEWTPDGEWSPQNFDDKFHGPMTIREVLEKSRNVPTVRLLQEIGPRSAMSTARRMGITSYLEPQLSMALGAYEVNLLELSGAYTAFATGGTRTVPRAIDSVLDVKGNLLEKTTIDAEKVLDPNVAAIMVDMMQGVVRRGTGYRARISRPAAAKTGTSQEFRDAWFIGFVPQMLVGVWVGNDDNSSMEGVAEVSVCPRAWKAFMEEALRDEPVIAFPPPTGLHAESFCVISGGRPTPFCPEKAIRKDLFFAHGGPTSICNIHTAQVTQTGTEESP